MACARLKPKARHEQLQGGWNVLGSSLQYCSTRRLSARDADACLYRECFGILCSFYLRVNVVLDLYLFIELNLQGRQKHCNRECCQRRADTLALGHTKQSMYKASSITLPSLTPPAPYRPHCRCLRPRPRCSPTPTSSTPLPGRGCASAGPHRVPQWHRLPPEPGCCSARSKRGALC